MTVPGIFGELGEPVFRKWEKDILLELCQRENLVVATGGGAPCHGTMMSTMNQFGVTVYIKLIPLDSKIASPNQEPNDPLFGENPKQELLLFITNLLEKREAFYNQATYIVDGKNLDPEMLARHLKES